MSIIRVGLSESQKCSDGYEAIFGKKKNAAKKSGTTKAAKSETKKKTSKKK